MVNLPTALGAGIVLGVVEQLLLANYPSGGLVELILFAVILVALLTQRSRTGRDEEKGSWSAVQAFRPLTQTLRQVRSIRLLGWALAAVAIPVAVVVPELTSNATATTCALIASFAMVGLSVGLVTGLGGQLSLGQFAIAGVGATASYVVTSHGVPFVFGIVAGAVAAGAVSLVIGLPAVRIRGLMLAVTTLGFGLAAQDWLLQQSWMLGRGVTARRPALGHFSFNTGRRYYLVALAALLVTIWLARNIWTSGIGRRIRAVRDNEDAARSFTVRATLVKLHTFVLGGVMAGVGGAVYGHLLAEQGASAYPIDSSINAAGAAAVGGLGVLVGPIVGSLYIIGLPQFIKLDNVGIAATSAGWLVLILQRPGGIAQAASSWRDRIVRALAHRAGIDLEADDVDGRSDEPARLASMVTFAKPTSSGAAMLSASNLTKRFGGLIAVDRVSLDVHPGEIVGLIGPNGAGKTTLFELLGGFTKADEGSIQFGGADITGLRPEDRAQRGLIRSFQDAALFPTLTVHESVMLAMERSDPTQLVPALLGFTAADRRKAAAVDELVAMMGLTGYRDTQVLALSTGTRRIAELTCLIALQPVLLLLDEPTSGIAQRETEALGSLLREVQNALGLTMVIIEHDIPLVMGLSDRVVAMESGSVLTVGTPAEVQSDARVIASYLGADVRAIERSARVPVGT
jgi:ABC-type branched-subunit amino acid transport system ATPase component/ABC-type branched-subunit amino acid transport system permease subunit